MLGTFGNNVFCKFDKQSFLLKSSNSSSLRTRGFGGFLGVVRVSKMAAGGKLTTFWESRTIVCTGCSVAMSGSLESHVFRKMIIADENILQFWEILPIQKRDPFSFLFFVSRQGKYRPYLMTNVVGVAANDRILIYHLDSTNKNRQTC